jgi:AraC-like DNA-binding protein
MQLELLSRTAYSVRDPVSTYSLGMALERQQGVHAIGTDRRTDFDTWPGTLAFAPPGVDVFSESESGGEYLVVRWSSVAAPHFADHATRRHQWIPHGLALRRAYALRQLLLADVCDALALEQATLALVHLERGQTVMPNARMRETYRRVLDRISAEFNLQLTIAQLAASVGKTPLLFLREFTTMVGVTPHAFIVQARVQAARAMIQQDLAPLSIIAADCGFTHQSHMGVAFRKVLGQTPGQYRATWKTLERHGGPQNTPENHCL